MYALSLVPRVRAVVVTLTVTNVAPVAATRDRTPSQSKLTPLQQMDDWCTLSQWIVATVCLTRVWVVGGWYVVDDDVVCVCVCVCAVCVCECVCVVRVSDCE